MAIASQLQLRRGTTAQHAVFTGAPGEVTVDTDKKTIVVHDGSTAGGFPMLPTATAGTGNVLASGSTASRTLSNRFADIVNVKDFGATGNGVSDDQAAIQAAVNAAPANAIIYFPQGTYFLGGTNGVSTSKSLAFCGDGDVSTILLNKTVRYAFRLSAGCDNAKFSNLSIAYRQGYFDTNAVGAYEQIGIEIYSNPNLSLLVSDCLFENIYNCTFNSDTGPWKLLFHKNNRFLYTHGFASCVWDASGQHPAVSILAAADITVVQGCYWNGLVDASFTGVAGSPPAMYLCPVDGMYFTASLLPIYQEVSGCTVINNGIEGIYLAGIAHDLASTPNNSLNKNVTNLTRSASGNANFPHLMTATCANHGYKVGEDVLIRGATGTGNDVAAYNGSYSVYSTPDANTFTYLPTFKGTPVSASAGGTITANRTVTAIPRTTVCKNNYVAGSPVKTQYYAQTQPAIRVEDSAGPVVEVSGNTIVGAYVGIDVTSIRGHFNNTSRAKPRICDNTISDVLIGIRLTFNAPGTSVYGNHIRCSSRWARTQTTWSKAPNAYCFFNPIFVATSHADIYNNTIECEEPLWDQTVTVTARNVGSTSFTLSDITQISNNLAPLTQNNLQDYGALQFYNSGEMFTFPITGISGSDVTIDGGYFAFQASADSADPGGYPRTAFWAKTMGTADTPAYPRWPLQAGIITAGQNSITPEFTVNAVNNVFRGVIKDFDALNGGPFNVSGNHFLSCRRFNASQVTRGQETRDGISRFGAVNILQGTGEPSVSAPDASIFIRTDGDASTTIYVRDASEWHPLASYSV